MSPFGALAGSVIATVQGVFGSSTAITYSRAAQGAGDAVAAFLLPSAVDGGGAYTSPAGGFANMLFVRLSDIPGGPMKGDSVVIANTPALVCDGAYKVADIWKDETLNWGKLELRRVAS